ncbi:MAG: hypothetical protein K2X90_01660 [Candidatus Babeliaceae bacterium]|nr:hypothetical protein [Candidatus Babeliaceae bacterium]
MNIGISLPRSMYALLAFLVIIPLIDSSMPACDISDLITRPVTNQALTVWALLDLAEQEHIVDQHLFYDELCQSTLKLCKEIQLLKESRYLLADSQAYCLSMLLSNLYVRFRALPEVSAPDARFINAIEVIFHYCNVFLKNNLSV